MLVVEVNGVPFPCWWALPKLEDSRATLAYNQRSYPIPEYKEHHNRRRKDCCKLLKVGVVAGLFLVVGVLRRFLSHTPDFESLESGVKTQRRREI